MKRFVLVLVLSTTLGGCAATGSAPSLLSSPPKFLATTQLGISETDIMLQLGPPTSIIEVGDDRLYVYRMGEGFGERTFSYLVRNGTVFDVVYNTAYGAYNGMSARTQQGLNP